MINIPARVLSGVIGTHSLEVRFLYFILVNLVSGVLTSLVFLYDTHDLLIVYAAIMGVVSGQLLRPLCVFSVLYERAHSI